jgi:hypothetical protein
MKIRNLLRSLGVLILLVVAAPLQARQTSGAPSVSLISLTTPTVNGTTVVTGSPGAVPDGALVSVVTMNTGHLAQSRASADGSFSVATFAPAGTNVMIKVDTTGVTAAPALNFAPLPGTILRVPDPTSGTSAIAFAGAGALRAGDPPTLPAWTFSGTVNSASYLAGDGIRIQGTLTIISDALQGSIGTLSVQMRMALEKLANDDGTPAYLQSQLSSTILTPTNLPIERASNGDGPRQDLSATMTRTASNKAELAVDITLTTPTDLPTGYYRPYISMAFTGFTPENTVSRGTILLDRLGLTPTSPYSNGTQPMYAPVVRVGFPQSPRLLWHLLTDTVSNGTRGVGANQDRTRGGVASRVLTQSDTFIIPRVDANGSPISYRLEPFLPSISVGDRGNLPNVPRIPFKFPSGGLTVSVQSPNGSVLTFGPTEFAQPRVGGVTDNSQPVGNISDPYQISTTNSNFLYTFPIDGHYVITMTGTILDLWGNSWAGGGTYDVYVARDLVLDTAVLPGTQFERNDTFNTGVVVSPAVPATVSVRFQMSPDSNSANNTTQTVVGVANRFGYLQPPGHGISLTQSGEYRVDITASYTDDSGNLWMGSKTWGGVVAPSSSSIVAHGSRGIDTQSVGSGQQNFTRSSTGIAIGESNHVFFPYNKGDVTWLQESDSVSPVIRFENPGGVITTLMGNRTKPANFTERVAINEAPLTSTRPDSVEPHIAKSAIDVMAYSYRAVEGPLVRTREEISEDGIRSPFFRPNESYARQIGASSAGDRQNDYKFQYGAAVIRGAAITSPQYALYGSFLVVVPDSDTNGGTRVYPPFRGNGGGTSGGPLMTLKGRTIELFFHPTAIRPGSVLEVGDVFAVSGAVAPTLAGLVSTTVTKPNGSTVSFSGRANAIGYYFHPEHDFTVDAPGMYTVDMSVTFDGRTSAGQVTQPYPSGDILGTTNGRFYVYVVPRGSAALTVTNTDGTILAAPAATTLSVVAPSGMTLQSGHMTTMMPGFVLDTGALTVSSSATSYSYDPLTLAQSFPNLETTSPSDVVTLTLFATGTSSAGPTYAAKVVTLHGSTLWNPTVNRTIGFGIPDRGGVSLTSTGAGSTTVTGFSRVQPTSGSTTPSGIAIFGFRNNGVLVSEAAVPATAAVSNGRIYAERAGTVNTGIAIANPNSQTATITFYFTDANGVNFGAGTTTIAANNQLAKFLNEPPFNGGATINGTFSFTSDVPVGVIALRSFVNEVGSFMMTTLPVSPISGSLASTIYFPHFADGGGWTSQIILVNPSDSLLTGTVSFLDDGTATSSGAPVNVTIGGTTAASFNYSIPARSSRKLVTSGAAASTRVGSVTVTGGLVQAPSGVEVFSYRTGGVTVSEAGVPASITSTAWRLYTEVSGGTSQIQTGVALSNPSASAITVNLSLTTLDGVSTGLSGSVTVPASGHFSSFLGQISGFGSITTPFRGVLRVTTTNPAGVSVVGIRGRYNERNEFLITTTAPVDENAAAPTSELIFPHLADSGGYTTQFILYNGSASQTSSGTLRTYANDGQILNLPVQ